MKDDDQARKTCGRRTSRWTRTGIVKQKTDGGRKDAVKIPLKGLQAVVGEMPIESSIISDVISERERDLNIWIVSQESDKRLKLGFAIFAKLKIHIGAKKV